MKTVSTKLGLLLAAASLMSACSTPVKIEENPPVQEVQKTVEKAPDTRTVTTVQPTEMDPLNDPKGVLANRSVYFDFDSYAIKSEYNGLLAAHAKYLSSHTSRNILVQGNTDERGGREYNLALGQKRAVAVTKTLTANGVNAAQLEAVSLGKEKPKATGNNEEAWAQNRRADIVYK